MAFVLGITVAAVLIAKFQKDSVENKNVELLSVRISNKLDKLGVGVDSWPWDQVTGSICSHLHILL